MIDPAVRRQSLSVMLRRSAVRHRDRTAIICGSVSWSYTELDRIVDSISHGLNDKGIRTSDRVAILARNSHAFVAVRFALARLGAVMVPVNFMLNSDEVRYILENSGACALFVDESTAELGYDAATDAITAIYSMPGEATESPHGPAITPWDALLAPASAVAETADGTSLLQIIYTSGTEAKPKGAMLTHDAVLWEYQSCVIDCEWTAADTALHAMPLFHCAQLDCMLGPALQVGSVNVITSSPTPENLIPLLARHRITSFFAPPTIWISLLRSPLLDAHDLTKLAKGYYGASIMPVEVLREIQLRFPALRLWNLYGQTEIAPVAAILFPDEQIAHAGSAGRATLHVETRVVDDYMRDVATGEIGEIVHRSPQLMLGYWGNEEGTAQAFADGWFHSGDLATIDDDGFITVVDRKKDMIKTGGENVSSREVEEAIYRHPAISEVAVIGLPDAKWIEAVTAVVVLKAGEQLKAAQLVAHCKAWLASFKLPKHVIFVEQLPRNASGKILKRDLRSLGVERSGCS
jgi:fatty-acyl-CoA synthase